MDCPELILPSDKNDSLSAGAEVSGTGPGRCDQESNREGGKLGRKVCPMLRVHTGPGIQEGLKRPQWASAWTSRCGHLEQPQHRGVMAASLQDPDTLGWHICTDASVTRLLEGQHPGPPAGAADLMQSSCLGPFPKESRLCHPCHTGARDLVSGQL